MMRDERCILVDASDVPLGRSVTKGEAHRAGGECLREGGPPHRAFSVLLFDDRDRLLVQRRSHSKRLFPGRWANTCCSHPLADGSTFLGRTVRGEEEGVEGVRRAARRKLRHEMGVRADELAFLARRNPSVDALVADMRDEECSRHPSSSVEAVLSSSSVASPRSHARAE